ncbi:MAG: DegT/DnrJ/EryC1/StrS family aminotransferase [Myxococcota bacterium]|nr:DegT/DnrJ/EryC1/StrS family aminotransferase [Myxococcota bacterium]MDP6243217.1 DegT/DnrJ/EryC1/StrS family aminotransferase [Myxococcota bacterium]MDP7073665.1 DegT/DnrJ/EryC1/StrS family aminotransferase [Myxococcota bacterium]MDP7298195.1 DegT/DnrJ/EryC1/StrS family aminotransferase [Myxococcota bacterium]MDP7433716.1 DegT/DnrJ/EryC1/StrS family aminotransferase [Myxococcota bacterium]
MIPYFDYRPGDRTIEAEIEAAMGRVRRSGRLVLGPEVEAFEREFAAWVGAAHGVGVASGTDALTLALRALEVGPGDEVITVANAGVPTVAAICAAGATPRFVDVDAEGLLLDASLLEAAVNDRTRCLLPVHLYGRPVAMEPLLELAAPHGLAVVEDCAQAHGARLGDRHVGTFGDIGCFSFYPTKNLGAYGDGGLCVTADAALAERLRRLRFYGFGSGDRRASIEGANSRLDEMQAAILRVKLGRLDAFLEERRGIAARYRAGLAATALQLPLEPPQTRHAFHLFVIQSDRRHELQAALEAAGIGSAVHYPEPVHRMEAYARLGYRDGDLPVSERASDRVLSLPIYPGLAPSAVDEVIAALSAAA